MTKTYSANVPALEPVQDFDDAALCAIGKLVRAVAETEALVTLYLCRLFGLTEGKAAILLGQMALSQRVRLAKEGAEANGGGEMDLATGWFDHDSYKMIVAARNAVAHGVMLGRTEGGEYALRVLKPVGIEQGKLITEVVLYSPNMIAELADVAVRGLAVMPEALKLEALLETRRKQPLGPHPKAVQPKKRSGGLSSRPRS